MDFVVSSDVPPEPGYHLVAPWNGTVSEDVAGFALFGLPRFHSMHFSCVAR